MSIRTKKTKRIAILFTLTISTLSLFPLYASPFNIPKLQITEQGEDAGDWWGSFHVGGTYPLGYLNEIAESNIHIRTDLTYRFAEIQFLMLMFGLNQFTAETDQTIAHPRWFNVSLNYMIVFNSWLIDYIQLGPGYYHSKLGHWIIGANIGIGTLIPITDSKCCLKFGLDWHGLFGPNDTEKFLTFQLGVLFRFIK